MIRIRYVDTCNVEHAPKGSVAVTLTGRQGMHSTDDEKVAANMLFVECLAAMPEGVRATNEELQKATRVAVAGVDFRPIDADGYRVCGDGQACCEGKDWIDTVEGCEKSAWFMVTWDGRETTCPPRERDH